jgi:hypothetical protein
LAASIGLFAPMPIRAQTSMAESQAVTTCPREIKRMGRPGDPTGLIIEGE